MVHNGYWVVYYVGNQICTLTFRIQQNGDPLNALTFSWCSSVQSPVESRLWTVWLDYEFDFLALFIGHKWTNWNQAFYAPVHITLSCHQEAGHAVGDTGAGSQERDAHDDVWDAQGEADHRHLTWTRKKKK